ncbi:Pycsar system effector family protein [Micromonospora sp. NPDC048935]|uniref:Pycsar system effector family protein n=1 Tax=Micromonospora sp. NPDC048935 TaxID=3364262 RepID=UPI00371C24B1
MTDTVSTPNYSSVRDDLRTQLARVDTKALGLSAINLGAIGLLGAVVVQANTPNGVRVGAGAGLAVVLWSLWFLLAAVAPNLTGNHGFVAYARANTPADLDAAIVADQADQRREIRWLSSTVKRKYQSVGSAVRGLMYAPVVAVLVGVVCTSAVFLLR